MTDIRMVNEGSIVLFFPETDRAREWIDDNVGGETTWFAGALVVEPRFVENLLTGMIGDGLDCSWE